VYARQRPQSTDGLIPVFAVRPGGIRSESGPNPLEENHVVRGGPRRAAERSNALDHLRMTHGPLKRLLSAHRPAHNQSHRPNAESLGNQPVLRRDIVLDGDGWKTRAVLGRPRVARRGRQTVTKLVKNDDEMRAGVQSPARPDQPLDVAVLRAERG